MRRIIHGVDRAVDAALFLAFLLLFLIGAYSVYDTLLVFGQAQDASVLRYKPQTVSTQQEQDERPVLQGAVAWLTVDDTGIDYPVMQGADNAEYLNKDPYGGYSVAGSIFLDAHNAPDFSDPYSLIYGHHMEHGLMFGTLDSFLDKDYFDSHREGTLVVINGVSYRLELFAAMETDASVRSIFDPAWQEDPLPYIREHAAIWYEPEGDCLIGLSTCKSLETTERIVVFGVLHEDEQ